MEDAWKKCILIRKLLTHTLWFIWPVLTKSTFLFYICTCIHASCFPNGRHYRSSIQIFCHCQWPQKRSALPYLNLANVCIFYPVMNKKYCLFRLLMQKTFGDSPVWLSGVFFFSKPLHRWAPDVTTLQFLSRITIARLHIANSVAGQAMM